MGEMTTQTFGGRPIDTARFLSDELAITTLIWDPKTPDEVAAVQKSFDACKEKGFSFYKRNDKLEGEEIPEFDGTLGKMICVPKQRLLGEMPTLDNTGDTKIIWDSHNPDEIAVAKASFDALKKKGFIAYKVNKKGEQGEVIHEFDPTAEKIILSPAPVGG